MTESGPSETQPTAGPRPSAAPPVRPEPPVVDVPTATAPYPTPQPAYGQAPYTQAPWGQQQPRPPAAEPAPPGPREGTGRKVFWFGLLGVFLVLLIPSPSWAWDLYRGVDVVVTIAYLAVLAVAGLMLRRATSVAPAAVLFALGGIVLLLPDLLTSYGYANQNTLVSVVSLTLLFAAYLAVRRVAGVAWVLLLPVLIVEYVWFALLVQLLFVPLDSLYRVAWPFSFVGGTALLALAALFAGKMRSAAAPPAGYWPPVPAPIPGAPAGWMPSASQATLPGLPASALSGSWPAAPGAYAAQPTSPWGYAPYYPPQPQRTNTLAVVALVLGVVGVSLGGVICGHIALSQIRRTGESGRGMAIAGLVLGYLWVAVVVILLIVAVTLASSSPY